MVGKNIPREINMKYHTVNLNNPSLTEVVEVLSINDDGTINTKDANRLMLLSTLEATSYPTQKDAERQAVKNFLSAPHLFENSPYYEYVKEYSKDKYPELVI